MSWDQAAVVEPMANAVTDLVLRAGIKAGDFTVVIGPGPIGLLCAMLARACGAGEVVIIGTAGDKDLRFKTARELGFTRLITVGEEDHVQIIQDMTRGIGADMVVECSGAPRAIAGMAELVRKMGTICAIGLTGNRPVELPWDRFAFKAAKVVFNMSTMYESWDRSISLIAGGAVPAEKVITHRAPLEKWEETFDAVEQLRALKALMLPR